MKRVEGFITVSCDSRIADYATSIMYHCKLFDVIGGWVIELAEENETVGYIVHISGWKLIVRFLEFITDYRGKNLSYFEPVTDENGEITWQKVG